jgi:uncharacterized protein with HEPN domain
MGVEAAEVWNVIDAHLPTLRAAVNRLLES